MQKESKKKKTYMLITYSLLEKNEEKNGEIVYWLECLSCTQLTHIQYCPAIGPSNPNRTDP